MTSPTPEEVDEIIRVLQAGGPMIVCRTRCDWCSAGQHSKGWHTWADESDVAHALERGAPDPSASQCGCWCQSKTVKPAPPRKQLIHKGRKP